MTNGRIALIISMMIGSIGAMIAMSRGPWNNEPVVEPTSHPEPYFQPRQAVDSAGYVALFSSVPPWNPNGSLEDLSTAWRDVAKHAVQQIDGQLSRAANTPLAQKIGMLISKASLLSSDGEPKNAYQVLEEARTLVKEDPILEQGSLYTLIYFQGVMALRRGETENCIMCRGESSCILPISPAAVHTNPEGSRLAIHHFMEYLDRFPNDFAVRWLLNVVHMTLGEYPHKVDPKYLLSLDNYFQKSEYDIGKFRDIGHIVGLNHFNQAGGAIMEDFDNDGLLDIAITSVNPTRPMNLFHNNGKGTFDNVTTEELSQQLGGSFCVQTDYNNDGLMDIFVARGGWLRIAMRHSLLRNDGNGSFTDVTKEAGLLNPGNSISASWADYDNDGWLDLFICCERQHNCLYHNLGNGTFKEVAVKAGLSSGFVYTKGSAWIDYDNDGYPDLYQSHFLKNAAQLFHNNRDGTFSEVTRDQQIAGPVQGFSCWAWDYDNDGWQDIFATCYDTTLGSVVNGMMGQPHRLNSNRLYHNEQGQGFKDVTKEAGLDMVFSTMGSNFGDFDNDGFLDMYLGTGEPDLAALVPNRMLRNIAGKRFVEITASSGTGNLQKGHEVACGDWDRDGNVDIFIEMGGAVPGDSYHNILFQNPGHDNHWLTVKLTGTQTNRPAIGARIKVVTDEDSPQTFYRHVSSGSSFGASPLQQTIGLAKADRIAVLEIYWPTSGTTQVFHDVAVDQAIAITEFDEDYEKLDWTPIALPKGESAAKMMGSASATFEQVTDLRSGYRDSRTRAAGPKNGV